MKQLIDISLTRLGRFSGPPALISSGYSSMIFMSMGLTVPRRSLSRRRLEACRRNKLSYWPTCCATIRG